MKITKQIVANFRAEMEAAMAEICERHGFKKTTLGNIRFTDESFRTSGLTFAPKTMIDPKSVTAESFVSRRFKIRQTVLRIIQTDGPNAVIGVTQRGKRYRIGIPQLLEMVEVTSR